jgi:hypothetical protein
MVPYHFVGTDAQYLPDVPGFIFIGAGVLDLEHFVPLLGIQFRMVLHSFWSAGSNDPQKWRNFKFEVLDVRF